MAAACLLAKRGWQVELFEKNDQLGGVFNLDGPSWYMMPDLYERFFEILGEKRADYFGLERLTPSYRVFFEDERVDMYSDLKKDLATFERLEPGVSLKFNKFISQAQKKYALAQAFMFGDYAKLLAPIPFPVFSSMHRYLKKNFQSEKVRQLLSYPYMFLGAAPEEIPALYSFMTYADFGLGVWRPVGGMSKIIDALISVGKKYGVTFKTGLEAQKINVRQGVAVSVAFRDSSGNSLEAPADIVISNADIYHTENDLLSVATRSQSANYWNRARTSFPVLLIYLDLSESFPALIYHNLFFGHFPFYVKSEKEQNKLFILVPLVDRCLDKSQYYSVLEEVLSLIEKRTGAHLKEKIVSSKFFGPEDFAQKYHYFRGSALGLAHTLFQTAFLRPSQRSRKLNNLFYVGANTNPGVGVPSCLASAARLCNILNSLAI